MQHRIGSPLRRSTRSTLLAAAAVAALFAAVPAAQADQQETSAEIDNALNWGAVRGDISGTYAQAPDYPTYREHRGHVRGQAER
jgi:hypothetical protein